MHNRRVRSLGTVLLFSAVVLMPFFAYAANPPLQSGSDSLGAAVASLYTYALSIVGLAVFIMFILAGLSYIIPDRFKLLPWMQKPNVMIIDAIIGFILLISSYLILNTINPDLVTPQSSTSKPSAPAAPAPAAPAPAAPAPAPQQPSSGSFEGGGGRFGGGGASGTF